MAQTKLIEQEIENGSLVYFSDYVLKRDLGYYLVVPQNSPKLEKIIELRDWLIEELN